MMALIADYGRFQKGIGGLGYIPVARPRRRFSLRGLGDASSKYGNYSDPAVYMQGVTSSGPKPGGGVLVTPMNPVNFATAQTAAEMASILGGSAFSKSASSGLNTVSAPQWWVTINGADYNAGGLANQYYHGDVSYAKFHPSAPTVVKTATPAVTPLPVMPPLQVSIPVPVPVTVAPAPPPLITPASSTGTAVQGGIQAGATPGVTPAAVQPVSVSDTTAPATGAPASTSPDFMSSVENTLTTSVFTLGTFNVELWMLLAAGGLAMFAFGGKRR